MKTRLPFLYRNFKIIMIIVLMIKIGGHFSIVEERSVNQVFKTISRLSMTGLVFLILQRMKGFGCLTKASYWYILPMVLYCCYLILGLASLSWSSNWQYSGLQWLMTTECFVFVVLFMRLVIAYNENFSSRKLNLVELFAKAIFPIMVIFLIGSFVEPDTFFREMRGGEEKRLGGWIMNPNELGMLSVIAASLSYIYIQGKKGARRKIYGLVSMGVAIAILLMTSSRSSTIGFVLIMGILILQSENRRLKVSMIVVGTIAAPVVINAVVFKDSGGVEEVMSMTGRLPFWTALLNEGIIKEPFLGYGFMRINYTDYFQGLNTYPGKMTHNTFMQVLMNLGFIGFFIAFWQLVTTLRTFFVHKKHAFAPFFIAVFIPIIINSFTEFGIFGESNYGILFYQFLIVLFSIQIRAARTPHEKIKARIFQKKMKRYLV